jgi:hypothetical protein
MASVHEILAAFESTDRFLEAEGLTDLRGINECGYLVLLVGALEAHVDGGYAKVVGDPGEAAFAYKLCLLMESEETEFEWLLDSWEVRVHAAHGRIGLARDAMARLGLSVKETLRRIAAAVEVLPEA